MRKRRHRELEELTQGHTAGKWERRDRTSQSDPKPVLWDTRWAAIAVERHGHAGRPGTGGLRKLGGEGGPSEAKRPSRLHKGCKLILSPLPGQGEQVSSSSAPSSSAGPSVRWAPWGLRLGVTTGRFEALTLCSVIVHQMWYFMSFNSCTIDNFTAEGGQPLQFLDHPAPRVGDGLGKALGGNKGKTTV